MKNTTCAINIHDISAWADRMLAYYNNSTIAVDIIHELRKEITKETKWRIATNKYLCEDCFHYTPTTDMQGVCSMYGTHMHPYEYCSRWDYKGSFYYAGVL